MVSLEVHIDRALWLIGKNLNETLSGRDEITFARFESDFEGARTILNYLKLLPVDISDYVMRQISSELKQLMPILTLIDDIKSNNKQYAEMARKLHQGVASLRELSVRIKRARMRTISKILSRR